MSLVLVLLREQFFIEPNRWGPGTDLRFVPGYDYVDFRPTRGFAPVSSNMQLLNPFLVRPPPLPTLPCRSIPSCSPARHPSSRRRTATGAGRGCRPAPPRCVFRRAYPPVSLSSAERTCAVVRRWGKEFNKSIHSNTESKRWSKHLLDRFHHRQAHVHAEDGMIRPLDRRPADAVVTVTENFYSQLLIFLWGRKKKEKPKLRLNRQLRVLGSVKKSSSKSS